jgi:hypothetical protein
MDISSTIFPCPYWWCPKYCKEIERSSKECTNLWPYCAYVTCNLQDDRPVKR